MNNVVMVIENRVMLIIFISCFTEQLQ